MTGGPLRWAAWGVVGATVVLAVVLASRFGLDPGLVNSPLLHLNSTSSLWMSPKPSHHLISPATSWWSTSLPHGVSSVETSTTTWWRQPMPLPVKE